MSGAKPKAIELRPCPFCGQWASLDYDCEISRWGVEVEWWEISGHTEYGCIMDDVLDELGVLSYPKALEFAEKWNRRAL